MIKRALKRATSQAAMPSPVTTDQGTGAPKITADQGAPVANTEGDHVADFRRMVDQGTGGARGLSARTRLVALGEFDRMLSGGLVSRAYAESMATCMSMGALSQGRTVSALVARARVGGGA